MGWGCPSLIVTLLGELSFVSRQTALPLTDDCYPMLNDLESRVANQVKQTTRKNISGSVCTQYKA